MSNNVPIQAVGKTISYLIKSILVITYIIFNFVLKEITFASIRKSLCRKNKNCEASDARISSRGYSVVYNAVVDDSVSDVGYGKWSEDPYCSATNPDGVMQLALAENHLSHDLLKEWFSANIEKALLDKEKDDLGVRGLVTYQCLDGLKDLKKVVAKFMSQVLQTSYTFNPSQVIITSGSTAAVEMLSFCLADPGDAFLIPSPYYHGFNKDVKWRSRVGLIPVPCRSADNFQPKISTFEKAYIQAKKHGIKVKAVIFTNPNNPVGNIIPKETLHKLLKFVKDKNIHLISDEVFAGSILEANEFTSISEILDKDSNYDKNRVHIVYGFSKDIPLPGFRAGVLYSYNAEVLSAASKYSRFDSVSVPAQRVLIAMLSDKEFISKFLETDKVRRWKMYNKVVNGLKKLGIECYGSRSGYCCWIDMRKFLKCYSEKGENEVWLKFLNVGKIFVIPGSFCQCCEPGWFRLCFTTLQEDGVHEVLKRIERIVESLKCL